MRMIDDLAPRWIVLENVPLMARWPGYGRLIQRLRKSYHITEQTLDAADFGALRTAAGCSLSEIVSARLP